MESFLLINILSVLIIFFSGGGAIVDVRPVAATPLPLRTDTRWIVGQDGRRVKLACVNWVSHVEAVVAEGLSKKPVDDISQGIKSMGFNCVRLTWPILLVTNDSLASLTVRRSFQNLGLLESVAGVQTNNPSIIDLPLIQAFQVNFFQFFIILLFSLNVTTFFTHSPYLVSYRSYQKFCLCAFWWRLTDEGFFIIM